MFIIMSSAYVPQEIGAEFGKIPPSFLPLANKRLFQHQIELVKDSSPIYMTVPEDFSPSLSDLQWLENHDIQLLKIDSNLDLGQALVTAWNLIESKQSNELRLLFGDTLFRTLPEGLDLVSISKSKDYYNWSHFDVNGIAACYDGKDKDVVCGYFSFSQFNKFVRELIVNKFNFVDSLESYRISIGLDSILIEDWLDFGHVNTYYKSKVKYTTQRSFNELNITNDFVEKSSLNSLKIHAESNWFQSVPLSFRLYTPQLLKSFEENEPSYRLEYLYNTALNELFVFSYLSVDKLNDIINGCFDFLDVCKKNSEFNLPNSQILKELFTEKTSDRIKDFSNELGFSLNDEWNFSSQETVSVNQIIEYISKYLPAELPRKSIMHGDLCFSNILYDFRTDRVKVIDPRGISHKGDLTIYGDYRYDIAKLAHSIIGLYDWIIAGYYCVELDLRERSIRLDIDARDDLGSLQNKFVAMVRERYGVDALSLYAMQIHLFLSMLPLHSDNKNRQFALFANAFRLYKELKDLES